MYLMDDGYTGIIGCLESEYSGFPGEGEQLFALPFCFHWIYFSFHLPVRGLEKRIIYPVTARWSFFTMQA
jgi:hypothetical protein